MTLPPPTLIPIMAILDFLGYMGKLKTLKRTGWVRAGVHLPESDSDHMHRAALCAMLVESVDRDRCIRMALVHDVCECIAGDLTPHCGVGREEKDARERAALRQLKTVLGPEHPLGAELLQLWEEYQIGTSPEAKYVKDIDKFEMILQADEYEQAQPGLDLEQFFASTKGYFHTPLFQGLDAELRARRDRRLGRG